MKNGIVLMLLIVAFSKTAETNAQFKTDSLYKVNKVKTVIYTADYAKIIFSIDSNGLTVSETRYSPNDSSISIPKYDNSGLRISDSIYYFVSKKFAKYSSKYDENKKYLGSSIITNNGNESGEISITEIEVLYDSLGNIIGNVTYKDNYQDTSVVYYKYSDHYENGLLVYKEFECDPKSIYFPIATETRYFYDNNKLIKLETYSKNCIENFSTLLSTAIKIYFANGLLKESITKYELDVPVSIVRYEYSFYK